MKSKVLLVLVLLLMVVAVMVSCMHSFNQKSEKLPDVVSYNFHIRPIFSDKCFKCHGPDVSKQQAGLTIRYRRICICST